MAEELKVKVTVENRNALRDLKTVDKSAEKTGKAFLGLGKAVGIAGGAFAAVAATKAFSRWMGTNIRLAQEQEVATTRLVSIAKGVTKATDEQIQSMINLSRAYQKQTSFADDVIQAGQSQLLSYAVTAEEAEKLTGSLLDALSATKGVTATQDDAINTANMLAKALNGNSGELIRSGIVLTDYQRELVNTGTQAQKVAALVDIVSDNFGGLAESLAQTNQGQLKQMENEIGDLREEVGEELLPAMIELKKTTLEWYRFILDNKGGAIGALKSISEIVQDTLVGWSWILKGAKEYEALQSELKPIETEQLRIKEQIRLNEEKIAKARESGENLTRVKAWNNAIELGKKKISDLSGEINALLGIKGADGGGDDGGDDEKKEKANKEWFKTFNKNYSNAIKLLAEDDALREKWALKEEDRKNKKLQSFNELYQAKIDALTADEELEDKWEKIRIAKEDKKAEDLKNARRQLGQNAISSAMNIANSIMSIKNAQAQQEISLLDKQMKAEIGSRNMSGRARTAIEAKFAKKREKIEKEQAEKNRKLQVAQAIVGLASGIAKIWSVQGVNPILAGINTALLTSITGVQLGAMKAQAFADGGVVDGFGTASSNGPDNRMATVRSGERILNANQQSRLDDVLFGNGGAGGNGGINAVFNIGGSVTSSQVQEIEDILYTLESNNRISIF